MEKRETHYHIFGASSGMGRWLALSGVTPNEQTYVYDIKIFELLRSNFKDRAIFLDPDQEDYLKDSAGNISSGDIIFIATPESALETLLRLLNYHIPKDCLVCVMTSRQEEILSRSRVVLQNAQIIGLHPLFGPTIKEAFGQNIAFCDAKFSHTGIDHVRDLFVKKGVHPVYLDSKDHDERMSYIQVLTHFLLLIFAGTISRSGMDWSALMEMKTPPFQFVSAFAARLLLGTPSTYASIQKTASAASIRKRVREQIALLEEFIDDDMMNEGGLIEKYVEQIREPFAGTSLSRLSQFSFIADQSVQEKERQFFNSKNNESIIVFETEKSDRKRVGRIRKINPMSLEIEEYTTARVKKGNLYHAIPFDDTSIESYRKIGITLNKEILIKVFKDKISILPRRLADEWISQNALMIENVITVNNPNGRGEKFFEEVCQQVISEIRKCDFIEGHHKKGEIPHVKLRIRHHPSDSIWQISKKLRLMAYRE